MNDDGEVERWRMRTFGLASGSGHAAVAIGLLLSVTGPRAAVPSSPVAALELLDAPSVELAQPSPPGPGPDEHVASHAFDRPAKTSEASPRREPARSTARIAERRPGNKAGHSGVPTVSGPESEPGPEVGTEAALDPDAGAAPTPAEESVVARAGGGGGLSDSEAPKPPPPPPPVDRSRGPIPPPLDRFLQSVFPVEAQRSRVGGSARVRVFVRRDGSVGSVERVGESRGGFGSACEEAMKISGRWTVALDRDGVPADGDAIVTCHFGLPERR